MGYRQLKKEYPREVINHAKGDYVIGAVHTNTIEGFWSILKCGVVGTFHKVSRKYLPLDVVESNSATTTVRTWTSLERP
jgi:hypothetical protein